MGIRETEALLDDLEALLTVWTLTGDPRAEACAAALASHDLPSMRQGHAALTYARLPEDDLAE
jgi:hypothetical protein